MSMTRRELVQHVTDLCQSTTLPLNVDAEQCYPADDGGIAKTVELLADAGAAGFSIEDWDPAASRIDQIDLAVERVREAATVADRLGLTLTARAENHLRGQDDLDNTIERLSRYRAAGAHVVYAPALTEIAAIARIVTEVGGPVNVLLVPGGPTRDQLAEVGVRRLSVGSSLARIAYGALYQAATRLKVDGILDLDSPYLDRDAANAAFSSRR
jgi:2-methylisocitrate lyase-like PEP mutase family enzyme